MGDNSLFFFFFGQEYNKQPKMTMKYIRNHFSELHLGLRLTSTVDRFFLIMIVDGTHTGAHTL